MVTTFISLLGSLAQANFVWNGDIVLNVKTGQAKKLRNCHPVAIRV